MSAAPSHASFLGTRRFSALDGLRCLAITEVVWHHAGGGGLQNNLGVTLSFALSGFLITTQLVREQSRTGTLDVGAFLQRRTLRIFPLYFLVLGVYVLLTAVMERGTEVGAAFWRNLPSFLTYTSNWFVQYEAGERIIFFFAWSLATQEQFYVLWPLVLRRLRTAQAAALALGVVLAGDVALEAAAALDWLGAGPLWMRILTSVAPAICLGSLAALSLHTRGGFQLLSPLLGRRWSVAVLVVLVLVGGLVPGTPTLVMAALAAALSASLCLREDQPLRALFINPVMAHVGGVSYGVYLLHMLVLNAVRRVLPEGVDPVALFAAGFPLAVLAGTLSYRQVEVRFLSLRDVLQRRGEAPRRMAEPVPGMKG